MRSKTIKRPIHEVRRRRGQMLLAELPKPRIKNFAECINRADSLVSQWVGRAKNPKPIGDDVASLIERSFGRPSGWLDIDDYRRPLHIERLDAALRAVFVYLQEHRLKTPAPRELARVVSELYEMEGYDRGTIRMAVNLLEPPPRRLPPPESDARDSDS